MKKLFLLVQILAIIFPIMIFIGYIVMDEGDQFTSAHYFMTGLSAIPFCIVQLVKLLMLGAEED